MHHVSPSDESQKLPVASESDQTLTGKVLEILFMQMKRHPLLQSFPLHGSDADLPKPGDIPILLT